MKSILIFLVFVSSLFLGSEAFSQVPLSISVKTASYTIPAGKWARVVANVEGSASFTIDGVIALRATENVVLASTNEYRYTYLSGSSTPGATGSVVTNSTTTTDKKVLSDSFFLPSGTIINGSGVWRATVELYER